jgi:hypothetical protein
MQVGSRVSSPKPWRCNEFVISTQHVMHQATSIHATISQLLHV